MTVQEVRKRIERELEGARETERANKAAGSPAQSTAFDAGRVSGLEDAMELLKSVSARELHHA